MPGRNNRGRGLTKKQRVEVKRLVQSPMEHKYFVAAYQANPITTTHIVAELMAIPQGDGEEQRDGNNIKITSAFYRGIIVAGDPTNVVRMTLIRWKPNSTPTAAQIYRVTNIGTNGAMFSDFNSEFRGDFVVLQDKFITVESTDGQAQKQFTLRCGNQPKTVFNDVATTGKNKLFLIIASDSLAAAFPTITMRGSVRYTDA